MADQGTSVSLYTEPYIASAQGITGTSTSSFGNYHSDYTTQSGINTDRGISGFIIGKPNSLPTPAGGGGTQYFKMVGYYVSGGIYESFVTTGSPATSSTTNPNTSHALINTYVAATWTI